MFMIVIHNCGIYLQSFVVLFPRPSSLLHGTSTTSAVLHAVSNSFGRRVTRHPFVPCGGTDPLDEVDSTLTSPCASIFNCNFVNAHVFYKNMPVVAVYTRSVGKAFIATVYKFKSQRR